MIFHSTSLFIITNVINAKLVADMVSLNNFHMKYITNIFVLFVYESPVTE